MSDPDFSDDASTFGDRITIARDALGLTQAELAERLGVRPKSVREWEQDRSEPRSNRLQMLAGILNVSIMWLMSGRGEGVDSEAAASVDGEALRGALLREVRAIKDDQIGLARRLARIERRLRAL